MSEMKAGRELDAMIADKVMGWTEQPYSRPPSHWQDEEGYTILTLPNFSTDIAAAWQVVERMRRFSDLRSFAVVVQDNSEHGAEPEWLARFDRYEVATDEMVTAEWWSSKSAAKVICIAALKAVQSLRARSPHQEAAE